MNGLKLVIGSRYASSWSLRPWLLLKQLGLPFEEIVIPLRQPDTALHIRRYSPSGKVPILLAGGLRIWDSLAIAEYLAEQHPALWPADRAARALARAACCEMHSGFSALRTFLPMDFTARFDPPGKLLASVEGDIDRIVGIWAECRRAAPGGGPFLFGQFTIADAMFAPVCSRFATYAVPLPAPAQAYVELMMDLPAMHEWGRLAHAELTRGERMPASLPADQETATAVPEIVAPPAIAAAHPPPLAAVHEPEPAPDPEPMAEPEPALAPVQTEPAPIGGAPLPPAFVPSAPGEPPAELRRFPRPIPSTIMVKPIGDGTRRRR